VLSKAPNASRNRAALPCFGPCQTTFTAIGEAFVNA